MTTPMLLTLILALLAASAVTLFGVAAGAFICWRLMRGMSPLPTIRRKTVVEDRVPAKEPNRIKNPSVGV